MQCNNVYALHYKLKLNIFPGDHFSKSGRQLGDHEKNLKAIPVIVHSSKLVAEGYIQFAFDVGAWEVFRDIMV